MVLGTSAQQTASNENLTLIYGEDKIIALTEGNEDGLAYLQYQNESGYYLAQMPADKSINQYPDALDMLSVDTSFPPLSIELIEQGILLGAYGFEISEKAYGYFRIGNTNQLMVVYPNELIQVLYEREQ